MVVLEPGTHAEFIPRGTYTITPFAAEQFPQLFDEPGCRLRRSRRSEFLEKATILHAEHHRPTAKPLLPRHSRHYYDLADRALPERVVRHKSDFFSSGWARYDLAMPGTFRLVPPEVRLPDLRRDYEATKVMLFSEPPAMDELLAVLARLEAEINGLE